MSTALAALLGAGVGAGIAPLVFAIFGAGESRSWTPRRVRGREGVRRRLLACGGVDRKSTRLNSSHVKISYAVVCLKNKKSRKARVSYKVQSNINASLNAATSTR